MKRGDLEELVESVVGGVYDEDDVGGNETAVPCLPPMPDAAGRVCGTPQRGGGHAERAW